MGDISTPKSPKINTFWVGNPKTWGYSCFGKDPPFLCGTPLEPSLEQLRLGPTGLELSSGGWNLALHFYFFVILPKKIERYNRDSLPSGKLTVCYWKWPIYSWFTHKQLLFSTVFCRFTRGYHLYKTTSQWGQGFHLPKSIIWDVSWPHAWKNGWWNMIYPDGYSGMRVFLLYP